MMFGRTGLASALLVVALCRDVSAFHAPLSRSTPVLRCGTGAFSVHGRESHVKNCLAGHWTRTSSAVLASATGNRHSGREQMVMTAAAAGDAPSAVPAAVPSGELKQKLKVSFYLTVWYVLTIAYNITNKRTLNMISIPWILSTVQLAVGAAYVNLIWALGLRKAPKLNKENMKSVAPLAALHTSSHIAAVIALGAGAVGFVQIVKAAEPFFTSVFSAVFLGQVFPAPVYAALIPVVSGVAVASAKEISFNWVSFGGAMISNGAAASRGVLAKASMDEPKGENMDAGNLYAVMTIMATFMLAPFAAIVEGPRLMGLWEAAIAAGHTSRAIYTGTILSGLLFYMYNEVAFYCLNAIHPVTHAVANTLKRVFLIAVSVIVFNHKLTPLGLAGSAVAIAGVLLYSLAKNHFKKK
ncbi:unnamed protein product [Choristocarpus tenellus]